MAMRAAVEVVDADDADGGVDRVVGHLAEDVASVAGLAAVDADVLVAPAAADAGPAAARRRPRRRLDQSRDQRAPVALLQRHLLGGVRHVVGQRDPGVGVARVEEDVRDRDPEGLGDRDAHLLGRALPSQREIDADDGEVDRDHDDAGGAVAEDESGRRQVALDRRDRIAEQPEPRLARAEGRVDRATRDAGEQRASAPVPSSVRRRRQVDHRPGDEARPARSP